MRSRTVQSPPSAVSAPKEQVESLPYAECQRSRPRVVLQRSAATRGQMNAMRVGSRLDVAFMSWLRSRGVNIMFNPSHLKTDARQSSVNKLWSGCELFQSREYHLMHHGRRLSCFCQTNRFEVLSSLSHRIAPCHFPQHNGEL